MSAALLCAPVQAGISAPSIPQAIMSNADCYRSDRSLSPLSDPGPVPYYDRKRTRTLRFPCKARGVPDNHNARNAYIDVPPDAGHGAIVICSHPVCSASGRKFRYCSVCMIPVAKRNFSKRHAHGILEAPQLPAPADEEEEVRDDASLKSKRQRLGTFASWGEALQILEDDLEEADKKPSPEVPKTIMVEADRRSQGSLQNETFADVSAASADSELTNQERQWLALFRQRPTNGTTNEAAARAWMEAILETAELKPMPSNHPHSRHEGEEGKDVGNVEGEDNEDSSILDLLMANDFLEDSLQ